MSLLAVRGLENTTEAFRRGLAAIAAQLGCDASMLAAVISFETGGTFRADIRNKQSGATGLIQFMPSTARRLGTTVEALARLTPEQQLPWVHKYLNSVSASGRLRTLSDHYAAVFAPAYIGKPEDTVMYAAPSAAYEMNKVLDANKSGGITKAEAARYVASIYQTAKQRGTVPDKEPGSPVPFLIGVQLLRLALKL